MSIRLDAIAAFRDALGELAPVPGDKAGLETWHENARRLEGVLRRNGLLVEVPEWFHHYLMDVDIRMKDPVYADVQNRQLAKFIATLNDGRIPAGSDLDVG